jgi:hypothetical protein
MGLQMQKIERQKIKTVPGRVGTPSKIKHQSVKQITGKTPVKGKSISLDIDIQPMKGVSGSKGKMGQSSSMRQMK